MAIRSSKQTYEFTETVIACPEPAQVQASVLLPRMESENELSETKSLSVPDICVQRKNLVISPHPYPYPELEKLTHLRLHVCSR